MHATRHAAIIGAIIIAALATIHLSDSFAAARTDQPRDGSGAAQQSAERGEVRIGTVDLYLVAERIMLQPTLLQPREQMAARFQGRLDEIEDQLRAMEARLQVLPQNDPEVQRILEQAQVRQNEYQELMQERQVELEAINARQLISAFGQTRRAAQRIADERGYTHILANRAFDRPIKTETVGATLQEMLARPLLVGVQQDDLTEEVLASLDLEPPDEGEGGIIIAPEMPGNVGPDR